MNIGTKVRYIDNNVEAKRIKVGDELVEHGKVCSVWLGGAWATFTTETGTVKVTRKTKVAVRVYGTVESVDDDYVGVLTATYANGGFKVVCLVAPDKVEVVA